MTWKNPRFNRKRSFQNFDLKDLLGRKPSEAEKRAFAREAIQRIIERTQRENRQRTGHRFKRYSRDYAEKKGVARSNVDMTLSEDMLGSITDKNLSNQNIVQLTIDDQVEAAKSHGHNTGGGNLPKREFFGLNQKEARQIARSVKQDTPAQRQRKAESRRVGDVLEAIENLDLELE